MEDIIGSTDKERLLYLRQIQYLEEQLERRLLASESEEIRQKTAESAELRAELQRESSRRRRQLEAVTKEGVLLLRHILTDSEETSETDRKMLRLQEILESSAPQAAPPQAPPPQRLTRAQKPPTFDPQSRQLSLRPSLRKLCSEKTSSCDPEASTSADR